MGRSRLAPRVASSLLAVGLAVGLTSIVGITEAAALPSTLFASPTGSGSGCSSAVPCKLTKALNKAGGAGYDGIGVTISLAPGTYAGPFTLDDTNTAAGSSITVEGTASSSTATVLDGGDVSATDALGLVGTTPTTVTDLEVTNAAANGLEVDGNSNAVTNVTAVNSGVGIMFFSDTGATDAVTASAVSGNSGAGIFFNGFANQTTSVTTSAISNNGGDGIDFQNTPHDANSVVASSSLDNGGTGIAFRDEGGSSVITDVTVSGNSDGGVLFRDTGANTNTITASTIAGNTGDAGGIDNKDSSPVAVSASIVAENHGASSAMDCGGAGLTQDVGYNIESLATCGFTGTGSQQNVSNANLALGAPANNGGPTETMALAPGSVAVNAVAAISGLCAVNAGEDQRGQPRLLGAATACDVGAFELEPAAPMISTVASGPVSAGVANVTDTATLSGGTDPTGSITFDLFAPGDLTCMGANVFQSVVTVNGDGNYTSAPVIPSAPGVYHWIAAYSGDTFNAKVAGACGDTGESVTVSKEDTSTTLTANPTNPAFGKPVTFTATVTPKAADVSTPSGTVTFFLNGLPTPMATVTLVGGVATLTAAGFGAGPNSVVAVYNGDSNFKTSASAPAAFTVTAPIVITGNVSSLFVTSKEVVLVTNATISGPVSVQGGGSVDFENSTLKDGISVLGAGAVRMCGTDVVGNVYVTQAASFVVIGDAPYGCAPNTITMQLNLSDNHHGVAALGNSVGGLVTETGNSGAVPFT